MSVAEWSISGPLGFAWTPEELAQIARAAQAFEAALPTSGGRLRHLVRLDSLGVLDGNAKVDWPQPGEGVLVDPTKIEADPDWTAETMARRRT